MNNPDLKEHMRQKIQLVEAALDNYFSRENNYPTILGDAMKYSLTAGGKRLRPILLMAATEACGGDPEKAVPAACALEMIHTYSLIHDDLPAMDNDDYRRGLLTNHKVYGEAMAILAGDGLLTMAFNLLARSAREERTDAHLMLQIIEEIAQAAGATGMIGGQVADLAAENRTIEPDELRYIHAHKTGALYRASLRSGAIIAGATNEQLEALTRYGEFLGLAFQITDDILDLEGDSEKLGKSTGSDLKKQKATYPSLFGMDKSREMAADAVNKAIGYLDCFGEKALILRGIAGYLLERDH